MADRHNISTKKPTWSAIAVPRIHSPNDAICLGFLGPRTTTGQRLLAAAQKLIAPSVQRLLGYPRTPRDLKAGSSLLNRRTTIWARCSALNVDFFPISPLLLRNTTSITDLRVQRNRSYTLERLELRCIEICLDAGAAWTLETLTASVIHAPANRQWRYHPETAAQARTAAAQARMATLRRPGDRCRLRLHGIPLHVNRFPWGVTLWAPYNEDNNRIMKTVAHHHGGFWNHKRRNWVVPAAERFDAIVADLVSLGAVVESRP